MNVCVHCSYWLVSEHNLFCGKCGYEVYIRSSFSGFIFVLLTVVFWDLFTVTLLVPFHCKDHCYFNFPWQVLFHTSSFRSFSMSGRLEGCSLSDLFRQLKAELGVMNALKITKIFRSKICLFFHQYVIFVFGWWCWVSIWDGDRFEKGHTMN